MCLTRAFDLLYVTIDKLGNNLMQFLSHNDLENNNNGDDDNHPSEEQQNNLSKSNSETHGRQSYLNLTKMIMFLMVNVVRKIELSCNALQQQQQDPFQGKKRGRGGKITVNLENNRSWDEKRHKFLIQLYNLLQFPLEKLWSPPIVEENFVRLVDD